MGLKKINKEYLNLISSSLNLDFVSFILCKLKDPERDIKKFLKLNKNFLSNKDLNFAPKVFRISPQLGYKICFEILKNKSTVLLSS